MESTLNVNYFLIYIVGGCSFKDLAVLESRVCLPSFLKLQRIHNPAVIDSVRILKFFSSFSQGQLCNFSHSGSALKGELRRWPRVRVRPQRC
jgi:hypothetical protein